MAKRLVTRWRRSQVLVKLSTWADSLPGKDFENIKQFLVDGLTLDSRTLSFELSKAIMESPPKDSDLLKILKRLRKDIGAGHPRGDSSR